MTTRLVSFVIAVFCAVAVCPLSAQQVGFDVPFRSAGHSFYEHFGTQWGLRGNGWFFNFGGPVAPPFGGFDPNAGGRFGFAGPGGFINFSAGQGSSTTFGGQTPFITLPNGGTGTLNDQILRPFVTGFIPVVGQQPPVFDSVLQERYSRLESGEAAGLPRSAESAGSAGSSSSPSSADHGEQSVAEIKARRAADASAAAQSAEAEIQKLLDQAQTALDASKPGVAKIYLQMAARRAAPEQREAILKQIDRLGAARP